MDRTLGDLEEACADKAALEAKMQSLQDELQSVQDTAREASSRQEHTTAWAHRQQVRLH